MPNVSLIESLNLPLNHLLIDEVVNDLKTIDNSIKLLREKGVEVDCSVALKASSKHLFLKEI